jgi:kynurenine formamidase
MPMLADFVAALDSGAIKVIDLSQPLGPDTPVIGLPPMIAQSPGVTMEEVSH